MPSRERRFIHVPPLQRGEHESFSDPLRPFWGPEYRHRIKQRLSGVCHWAASQGVLMSITGPSSFWLQALLKGVRTAWILLLLWVALALASSISMRAFTVPQGVWFKKGEPTSVSSDYPECLTQKRRSTEAGRKVSHVDKALDQGDPSSKLYRIPPRHRNKLQWSIEGGTSRTLKKRWPPLTGHPAVAPGAQSQLVSLVWGWVLLFLRLWRS